MRMEKQWCMFLMDVIILGWKIGIIDPKSFSKLHIALKCTLCMAMQCTGWGKIQREPTLQWVCHHIIPVQLKLEWCVIFSRDMCSAHIIVHYVHLNWSCITILLLLHLNFSSPSSFAALTFALIFALIFAQLNLKVTSSHHSSPPHTIIFNSANNISFHPYLQFSGAVILIIMHTMKLENKKRVNIIWEYS